ncbi:cilia- and flagella-associated protein 65 [Pholidichthys leucotaenia]
MLTQKRCFLGVETRPELVWEDWHSGGEFTKTLVLKNVHTKLQKIHIRPPVSTFFSILSPQVVVISPGTSISIQVTFRPIQRCEYEDSIDFQSKEGNFQVCLRAVIPCHTLEVPDSMMLPLCAVQHSTNMDFLIKNVSKLQTCFKWECAPPFQLIPEKGLLRPGQECAITVVFMPQEALVHQQRAYCWFGEEADEAESCCTVLLQGLAKHPYLQLRSPSGSSEEQHGASVVQFGPVAVGQSLQKHFDIFNPTPVPVSFSLERLHGGVPLFGTEFTCDVTSGSVAPGESLRASVTYFPAVVDSISVEYVSVKSKGGLGNTVLKLTGSCIGPKVSLSSSVLDFGCVEGGGSRVQLTVELINSSPVKAIYQWDIDCSRNCVFSILPASGTVPPQSRTTLKAVYRPTQPNAHHRRVACLILHRDPLFLDLIGTCHSELEKPAILKPEHLILYNLHWERRQNSPTSMNESHQKPDSAAPMAVLPMEEFFQASMGNRDPLSSTSLSSSPHVSVVPCELLFNHKMTSSSPASSGLSQFVSITNHTRGKLSLVWTISHDSPFSISPSSCDLAPLKSTSFRVTYEPKQLNTLHGAQLECFAYYKDSGDVGQRLLRPPWCVTVRVIGHSFQPGKEHFNPCCSLKPNHVMFPALSAIFYRTALLQNDGDFPLTFCLDHSLDPASAESVFVVPSCGLIQPGDHQILTVRTLPTENSPKEGFTLHLQLNAANHTKKLTVMNVVENSCVCLEGGSSLFFQPTAVGSQTQLTHQIRNLSLLPVRFQWSIPDLDQDLIFVEPDTGELHPNESLIQTWCFSPLAEKTYTIIPTLTFWPVQINDSNKFHLTLKIVGMGSRSSIEVETPVLDLGKILVGSCQSVDIPLINNSPSAVSFVLSVTQTLFDDGPPTAEQNALRLDSDRGSIPSYCTMLLQSTIRPHKQAQYLWTIYAQTLNASGCVSSPSQVVCEVRASGVFPTLQVTDVYGGGSLGRLSKIHLRKLFSLDSLNEQLLSSPSPTELIFRTPTRHSMHSSPSIFTKVQLDFHFNSAPVNSDPSNVLLIFHNPGPVPVDWAFLFPEDQQIELEYWAVTGEFSSNELDKMKVQDNQLFTISPRSGTLLPGQKRAVNFSYSHIFTETNQIPVVFKLSYGREILLNFQGVTVESDRPHLHFASCQHFFTPVPIGDCSHPKQGYELHNGGAVAVWYEVDTAVLSQLQRDNFNHPVLHCISPQGEIPPGKTVMLEWIFSPLEARMYHMDVPIHIQGAASTLVRFVGRGLEAPMLGATNPLKSPDFCVKRVPFPGQVLFLSEDSIFLGNIPVHSQSSRIFFLTNVSCTETVHYTWDLPQNSNQQVVQIHPDRGCLRAGQCVLCVLTFTSTDYPTVYQLDLICQVTLEAELTQYQNALQSWEEDRERQQNEFTISDKNVTESQQVLVDEPPPVASRKGSPFRQYKTLPPIRASNSETVGSICNKLNRHGQRLLRESTKVWRHPQPPKPTLLHLEITAHSHGLVEYLKLSPDHTEKRYRFRQSVKTEHPESTSSNTFLCSGPSALTHGPEKDISAYILTSLLRNLLDDSSFVQFLSSLACTPKFFKPLETSSSHFLSTPSSTLFPSNSATSSHCKHQPQVLLTETVESKGREGYVPADISEDVLMNTLQNLMMEAVRGELVLTADHCNVVIPPFPIR